MFCGHTNKLFLIQIALSYHDHTCSVFVILSWGCHTESPRIFSFVFVCLSFVLLYEYFPMFPFLLNLIYYHFFQKQIVYLTVSCLTMIFFYWRTKKNTNLFNFKKMFILLKCQQYNFYDCVNNVLLIYIIDQDTQLQQYFIIKRLILLSKNTYKWNW